MWSVDTWEEPFLVRPSAADNTCGIDAAIAFAEENKVNRVRLPVGLINTTGGHVLNAGVHLEGCGCGPGWYGAGTELFLLPGSNRNILETKSSETWHWGIVERMRLNGNNEQNVSGSCLSIHQGGETSEIRNVLCVYAAEYSYEFTGINAPARMTACSGFHSGSSLLRIGGGGAGVFSCDGLSGDSNHTFIRIDGSTTLTVKDLKAEWDHEWLIDMPDIQCSVTVIGGYVNGYGDGPRKAIFRIRDDGHGGKPEIKMIGLYQSMYENILVDESTGHIEPMAASGSQQVMGVMFYNCAVR